MVTPCRRERRRSRSAAWCAALLLAPGPALAQAPPAGEPAPAAPAGDTTAAGASAAPRWTVRVSGQESWDSAARAVGSDPDVHYLGRLRLGLTHARGGRRGQLVLSGQAASSFAQEDFSPDRLAYDASLLAAVQLGSRLRLTLTDNLHTDYSDESPLLGEEGTVLPLVLTRENSARAELAFRWSERTSLATALRHDVVGFDSEGLLDRASGSLTTRFRRQLGPSQDLSLDHAFLLREAAGRRGASHRLSAGWSATRQGRRTLSLSLGLERQDRLSGAEARLAPYGALGVSARWRRSALSLSYEHALTPSYETLDDREADTVAAAWYAGLSRRLGATVTSSYSRRRAAEEGAEADHMLRAGGGLTLSFPSGAELSSRYTFQSRRRASAEGRLSRHRVELAVAFGRSWR